MVHQEIGASLVSEELTEVDADWFSGRSQLTVPFLYETKARLWTKYLGGVAAR
jgi:hypothetical protein